MPLTITAVALQFSVSCFEPETVYRALSQRYGERPVAIAKTDDGDIVQFWKSDDGMTWTVIRFVDGRACVIGAGGEWVDIKERPKPPDL